jgi:outer membrane immunogenic protein
MRYLSTSLIAAASTIALTQITTAADMPVKAPRVAPAAYDWTGLYFGAHAGGGWQSTTVSDPSSHSIIETFGCLVACDNGNLSSGTGDQKITNNSFLGGVQAGANYQIGRLVLGSEFDFSWTRLNGTSSAAFPSVNPAFSKDTESVGANTKWIATATTRLGIARDNTLLYAKAGAAWAQMDFSLAHNGGGCTCGAPPWIWAFGSTTSDTLVGWTVGTGLEWAFGRNWTAKLEYDFLDFGTKAENFGGAFTNPQNGNPVVPAIINTNVNQRINEVKFGLNYKLDPGFLFW